MPYKTDVIIIGGGHAGAEAAAAAARSGADVMLVTQSAHKIGEMSCNPAIGGIAKGTLVKEIDALDGIMAQAIDRSGIQFRMLNSSKGPAVHGPRAQADRELYKNAIQESMLLHSNITIIEDIITSLSTLGNGQLALTGEKNTYVSASVVVTTGTFLRGLMHFGCETQAGGRVDDHTSNDLSASLECLGFTLSRLKTGTPARLNGDTIIWDATEEQPGDSSPIPFSFMNTSIDIPQISCYITRTTQDTHRILQDNLHLSPMYSGAIKSKGPRYCPSIEDKIVRFADKTSHQIFLEPEGLNTNIVYPNGISTSLPAETQDAFIRTIPGLESVEIMRYGYAVEYDIIDARTLKPTLESIAIKGLFFAGQINGTTGYEEAAGQGLVAGINAARTALGKDDPFILPRHASMIGVMIDDLTTLGTTEPYRMFTSRAEYRLHLRPDNADRRLTPLAIAYGFCKESRKEAFYSKASAIEALEKRTKSSSVTPSEIKKQGLSITQDGRRRTAYELLSSFSIEDISNLFPDLSLTGDAENIAAIRTDALYAAYTQRIEKDIQLIQRDESLLFPADMSFDSLPSLSNELKEKLKDYKPYNLAAAARIPGITPAALTILAIAARQHVARTNTIMKESA